MRTRVFSGAMVGLLVFAASSQNAHGQVIPAITPEWNTNPLGRMAQLEVRDISLTEALLRLQEQSGVRLAFSPSLISALLPVTCDCGSGTVGEALDQLLAGTPFEYGTLGQQVLIERSSSLGQQVLIERSSSMVGFVNSIGVREGNGVRHTSPLAIELADPLRMEPGTVTGMIVNAATNQPLGSAQVFLVGTSIGTISTANGRFVLPDVPAGSHEIRVELMGFQPLQQEFTIAEGGTVDLQFRLTQQVIALDEIVVTGTAGAATRRELGNSVGTVTASDLEMIPSSTISEVLQGQVAGLQVFSNAGQVGMGNTIVLRGINSVTQGFEPLIYIDGVRVNNPSFSANIYTGTASAGNPGAEGAQTSPKPFDSLNPNDIARIEVIRGAAATTLYGTEAAGGVIQIFTKRGHASQGPVWSIETKYGTRFQTGNGLGPVVGKDPEYLGLKQWLDNGRVSGVTGSVTGGTEEVRYFLSALYDYEEGVLPNNNSGRFSARGNFGFQPHKSLLVDVTTSYARRNSNFAETGDNTYGILLNVFRGSQDYTGGNDQILFDIENTSSEDRFVAGVTLTHTPNGTLTNRAVFGLDFTSAFNNQTVPFGFQILPTGRREVNRWTNRLFSLDYTGTWSHELSQVLSSTFSWGGQVFHNFDHAQFGTAEGFGGPGEKTLRSGAVTRSDETELTVVNAGFFFQEILGYDNRLFLTVGGRADGNSAFGEDLGLQFYPKVSTSYVISEEEFWPEGLGIMRLRGAIGESGKAPGAFDAIRSWTPVAGYEGRPGVTPATVGNPDLGPERTRELEMGFESTVLRERITADFSWYRSTTRDALFHVPASPSNGFLSSPLRNVGKLENKGIELKIIGVPVATEAVRWMVSGSYSTNKSKVLDLGGSAPFNAGFAFLNQWIRQGYPIVSTFGTVVTNPDEVAEPIYESDVFQGAIYPTHQYSLSTSLNLGGQFTFYVLGEGTGGNVAINNMARQGVRRDLWPQCYGRDPLDQQPAIWQARCQANPILSVWTQAADVFRLRTVSLSYQLPEGLIPGSSSASIMVSGQNLWKSQKHIGLDPSLNRGGRYSVAPARYEYYQMPPSQVVILQLRAKF